MSNGAITTSTVSNASNASHSDQSYKDDNTSVIPRSASYTQLSQNETQQALPRRPDSIRRSFSENVLANAKVTPGHQGSVKANSNGQLKERRLKNQPGSFKRRSAPMRSNSKVTVAKFTVGDDPSIEDAEWKEGQDRATTDRERVKRSVSGTISKFARRSWISTASRSPSPSPNKKGNRLENTVSSTSSPGNGRPPSRSPSEIQIEIADSSENGSACGPTRRNSLLGKKARRPLSAMLSRGPGEDAPSVPPIPKSFSTDRLPTLDHNPSVLDEAPALPKSASFERLQNMGVDTPRRKDELWGAFRHLDGEYHKFPARPSTMKTAIVRSALLPFLRTYAQHSSISTLRPEDLDRRTVILNKWWTGLLEMLNGRHGESVSGNDRPAILEAVTALMVRPEWTLTPSAIPNRSGRTLRASLKSRSTTSLGSTMSDFLVDSVFHNMKNTFTQNLLAQMAYVVDKMSMRNVAASVVTFCGKATAYAFFYCEGVADILVRLWAISPETLRRVLAEHGVQRNMKLDSSSTDKICSLFPPCLHSLALTALRPMVRYLRSRPHLPIATAYIPWHGPWVGRWAGRDTDLFFVFAKFYTDLACRFLPDDHTREERMATPGWALVQAQLLTVLDATLQRINSQPSVDHSNGPSSITFDEMLGEADATATILPLPANGVTRSMAENRIIMLLRDCLSGSTIISEKAQNAFAESFDSLLKAAARRTSLFDHNACFTLCDFLEEAIAILIRYKQVKQSTTAILDWPFWLDVCKKMLQSYNSMTEVRLCAFLYSMWGTITSDEGRKREICLGWLLSVDTFQIQFNHWCPMVRAFFMRLLVWKVARLDGDSSDLDVAIIETLSIRLHETWCQFLYIREESERLDLAPPSTAPCSPAPGRRLLIVRDDVQPAPSGMFLSFDSILSSSSVTNTNPYEKHSSRDPFSRGDTAPLSKLTNGQGRSSNSGKKRWVLWKSRLPFSSSPDDLPSTSSSIQGSTDSKAAFPGNQSRPHSSGVDNRSGANNVRLQADKPVARPRYQSLSFKFSLEWIDRETSTAGQDRRLYPPKLPPPTQMALQSGPTAMQGNKPCKPEGIAVGPSKYAGRALAEWALLIIECQIFFERRNAEGVPTYQMVETPMLGVDPFRKV